MRVNRDAALRSWRVKFAPASRSANAAKEIESLINESVSLIDQGSGEVVAAGNTMNEIVEAVKRVTDIMLEIAAASDEQSRGIVQVSGRFPRWIR